MTSYNQDFTSYAGDDLRAAFTIRDGAGATIDVSEVTDIIWNLYDEFDALVLSRSLLEGDVSFVTDGSDGQITVAVSEQGAGETADLSGWYWHAAYVVDSVGDLSTFETGRGLFGPRIVPDNAPSLALREDGGHALRQDGGLELRE